jgi:predicted ATPase
MVQTPEVRADWPLIMEAEACLQQALTAARQRESRTLELRAAMSLSRLWRQQDRGAEAQELLNEIYRWFTEGLDTADLQAAKALLEGQADIAPGTSSRTAAHPNGALHQHSP